MQAWALFTARNCYEANAHTFKQFDRYVAQCTEGLSIHENQTSSNDCGADLFIYWAQTQFVNCRDIMAPLQEAFNKAAENCDADIKNEDTETTWPDMIDFASSSAAPVPDTTHSHDDDEKTPKKKRRRLRNKQIA